MNPATYDTRDHYNIFDGDEYEAADKYYNELRANGTTHSANLCLVLKSTDAYKGVEFNGKDKDNT